MNKIFDRFFTGFVGTCVLAVPLMCLLAISHFQSQLVETQERLELVSKHLGYVEDRLNNKPPEIVYQVDSSGGNLHGTIKNKEQKENGYAVEVENYGWFLVTKEQYESITVGDDAPEFLMKRGS